MGIPCAFKTQGRDGIRSPTQGISGLTKKIDVLQNKLRKFPLVDIMYTFSNRSIGRVGRVERLL